MDTVQLTFIVFMLVAYVLGLLTAMFILAPRNYYR